MKQRKYSVSELQHMLNMIRNTLGVPKSNYRFPFRVEEVGRKGYLSANQVAYYYGVAVRERRKYW